MKKILLANASLKSGNRGCVALCLTSMLLIKEIFEEKNEVVTFYLPNSFYPSSEMITSYRFLDKNLEFYACGYGYFTSFKSKVQSLLKNKAYKRDKRIFDECDFILDIGQGDSFADIYGLQRFNWIDAIHVIARKLNKPYCLLPQTIGPFANSVIARRAHESIAHASICMTRDKQSFDYVVKNIPEQSKVREYIDVAFFMPFEKIEQNEHYTHVGINVSALIWNGGYTQDNQFGLKCDYKKTVHDLIDFFLSLPNTKVHFIPHVVGSERGIENDYEVSYELWREYNNPNLILAPFALGPVEIKSYIAGMDFFLGARMHATIGAFSSGVPVVPMAYSRKFNGLFVDTLQYDSMVDMKKQSDEEILSVIKEAFSRRLELKNMIKQRMEGVVAERRKLLIDDLTKFFNLEK